MSKAARSGWAYTLYVILPVIDFLLLVGSFGLALWLRFSSGLHSAENPFLWYKAKYGTLIIMALVWIGIFRAQRLYHTRVFTTGVRQVLQLVKGVTIGTLGYIFLSYLLKSSYIEQSRLVIGYSWGLSFGSLAVFRCLGFKPLFLRMVPKGVLKRVLVVGAGQSGIQFVRSVRKNTSLGIEVAGFVDDAGEKQGQVFDGIPVLGPVDNLNEIVPEHRVDEIYIAISTVGHQRLLEIVTRCRETKVPVQVISDLYNVITSKIDVERLDGVPLVEIKDRYVEDIHMAVKRLVDIAGAGLGLLVWAPLMAVTAVIIKATSPGPVFFKQVRIGKNGRRFTLYKFRTMVADASDTVHRTYLKDYINGGLEKQPEEGKVYKLTEDARITKIGSVLRKLSIDELPQLVNVLKGEMSLVGPRPCLPYEFEQYQSWHKRRFNVLPGITGLWQVSGRSTVTFDDMIMLDLYYIENMSLWFDIQIILKTIPVVLAGKGGH